MRALVVFESMFGNTREVAAAVAAGIGATMPVDLVEVGEAPTVLPPDVALLVVGAPTHAHGMTTPETRADATRRAGDRLVSHGQGVREWLAGLQPPAAPVAAAVFDTRIKGPEFLWGSAARKAEKELRAHGFHLVRKPESFLVGGPTGPLFDRLADGELERARGWGGSVAASAGAPALAR